MSSPNPTGKSLCNFCSKSAGLLPFQCRCGNHFCMKHRLPEQHSCSFDYIKAGKTQIANSNPLVQSAKLAPI